MYKVYLSILAALLYIRFCIRTKAKDPLLLEDTLYYFYFQVGSGEVFSINEEPLDKVKEVTDWDDLDESSFILSTETDIPTVAAFNHVYGAKDCVYNTEFQTKICLAHHNTSHPKKVKKNNVNADWSPIELYFC